jgi:hypothetical protein
MGEKLNRYLPGHWQMQNSHGQDRREVKQIVASWQNLNSHRRDGREVKQIVARPLANAEQPSARRKRG